MPLITLPHNTWASETGSWIDGTFRYNGTLNTANFTLVSRSRSFGQSRANPSSLIDVGGNYLLASPLGNDYGVVKFNKDLQSHTVLPTPVGVSLTRNFWMSIVNRNIGGAVHYILSPRPGFVYQNSDTEVSSVFYLRDIAPNINLVGVNDVFLLQLDNRRFLLLDNSQPTYTAHTFDLNANNEIVYVGRCTSATTDRFFPVSVWRRSTWIRRGNDIYLVGYAHQSASLFLTVTRIDSEGNRLWTRTYPYTFPRVFFERNFDVLPSNNFVFIRPESGVVVVTAVDSATGDIASTITTNLLVPAGVFNQNISIITTDNSDNLYIAITGSGITRYNIHTGTSTAITTSSVRMSVASPPVIDLDLSILFVTFAPGIRLGIASPLRPTILLPDWSPHTLSTAIVSSGRVYALSTAAGGVWSLIERELRPVI